MSHVDEGTLHAYLDHADGPTGAWREVEDHLATCADCRRQLDDARALRERAAEILAASGPAAVPVPPFDTVLTRAGGKAPRRAYTVGRLRAIGWAASVALAVGVGWIARGALPRLGSPDQSFTATTPRTAPSDSTLPGSAIGARPAPPAVDERPAAPDAGPSARGVEDAAARLRSAYAMSAETEPSAEVAAERQDAAQRNAAEPVRLPSPEAPAAAAPQAKLAQDVGAAVAERREQSVRTRAAEREAAATAAQWIETDSVGAAERLGEALHVVPGVPIVRIDQDAGTDGRLIRVVQDLSGVPLEILYRPGAALEGQVSDRKAADALALALDEASGATITVVRGSIVMTLRANLAPDSLRSLAARIP